jgi:uncharacterized Tic20 family protein
MATEPTPTPPTPPPAPGQRQLPPLFQPPPATPINSDSEDRTWAMLCHLVGIIPGCIITLVLWTMKKDDSRYVDDQGKEALNFQLTLLAGDILSFITLWIYIGVVLWIAVFAVRIAFSLLATMAANKGEMYRYPFAARLVKGAANLPPKS